MATAAFVDKLIQRYRKRVVFDEGVELHKRQRELVGDLREQANKYRAECDDCRDELEKARAEVIAHKSDAIRFELKAAGLQIEVDRLKYHLEQFRNISEP